MMRKRPYSFFPSRIRPSPVRATIAHLSSVLSRRPGALLVFLRQKHHAGHRFDPREMIVHGFHAGHILGRDDKRFALPIIGDHAPKTDYAIAHHHIDVGGPPLLGTLGYDLLADCCVVAGRWLELTRDAPQRMKEIGSADDTDELAVLHDRQPLHAMTLHQAHNFLKWRLGRDGLDLGCHDLSDLLPRCLHVFSSQTAGAEQEFQPARPLTLSSKLATP